MIITEDSGDGMFKIQAYKPGAITINEKVYTQSLIISPNELISFWEPQSLTELKAPHLNKILTLKPEIILLGTGQRFIMPPTSLLAPLYAQKLSVENMDTGAACRTYTALMTEGRKVVAALLID